MHERGPLDIPDTLDAVHAAILRDNLFETAGTVKHCQGSDAYDKLRVIYAITNPTQTAIIYVGESEQGRDFLGRLKEHMNARDKAGMVEQNSMVFVHVLVTERHVLDLFVKATGKIPAVNKRISARFAQHVRQHEKEHAKFQRRVNPHNPQVSHGIIRVVGGGPSPDAPKIARAKPRKPRKHRWRKVTVVN